MKPKPKAQQFANRKRRLLRLQGTEGYKFAASQAARLKELS